MSEHIVEETKSEVIEKKSDSHSDLQDLREEIADLYLTSLDGKKEGILGTAAGFGLSLNPLKEDEKKYLLSLDDTQDKHVFSNVGKKLKKRLIEKLTGGTIVEYNKSELDKMKALIAQYKDDKSALETIKSQIEEGKDPIQESLVSSVSLDNNKNTTVPVSIDKVSSDNRKKVLSSLDEILSYDQKHPIHYTWGGKDSVVAGLDCSGLLVYTMHQAGFEMPGGNSTAMFKNIPTEKLDMNDEGKITNLTNIKPGDPIFWNTTNPDYDWKNAHILTTKKDGNDYRIHHVAIVKEVTSSGKIIIVESNGSDGVVQRELDCYHELKDTKHNSELYLGHLDYDKLLAYVPKDKSKEQAV